MVRPLFFPGGSLGDLAVNGTVNDLAMSGARPAYLSAAFVLEEGVELTVVDTPPQVKGATATNQLKDALCEGGAKVRVPPFVENGTKIKVDTRTGEYLGRA